ncbi:MAG: PAS domain S-box protein [Planctomycetes bacterium]|nr:PAS domain S-box protein [Planctomycetota bacterium]
MLPPAVRAGDTDHLHRARLAVTYAVALILLGLLYTGVLAWLGSPGSSVALALATGNVGCALYLMRRMGSPALLGNLLAGTLLGVLTFITCRLGGHGSPSLAWYAAVPIIAMSTAGRRSALLWLILAIAALSGFYLLDLGGFVFPQDATPAEFRLLQLAGLAGMVLVIATLAYFYESFKDRTLVELRQMEANSRREKDFVASTIDSLPGVFYLFDEQGHFLRWNQNFGRVSGYSSAELAALHPLELFAGADKQAIAEGIHQVFTEGQATREADLVAKDGTVVPYFLTGKRVTLDGKQYLVGMGIDISERRRADETLRLNEARLEALLTLNQMTDAPLEEITNFALESAVQFTRSKLGYLAFTNEDESVLTMHAWSREALARCEISDKPTVYPVADTGLWGEAIRQRKPIITNDYGAPSPLKKGYPPGHVAVRRHMSIPVFDDKRIVAVAGVGNKEDEYDETDVRQMKLLMQGMWRLIQRKRATAALHESEERFRSISMSALDAIVMMDARGEMTFWNAAAENIFGYARDEALGRNLHSLLAPSRYHAAYRTAFGHFQQTGQGAAMGRTLELTALRKDGTEFPVELSISPIRLRDEWHAVGIIRDITDRKRTEAELQAAKEAAEAANRAKSEFLANMSHEIRTPMTAILGFAESLLAADISHADMLDAVHTIRRNGDHLLQLINDILDLTKIEAGLLEVERLPCSPMQMLAEVQSLMGVRAGEKHLSLDIEYDGPLPETIQTDPTRLRQILVNLIGNAVKFTEQGGVRLVARLVSTPEYTRTEQAGLQIDVIDSGIGLSAEQMSGLFQAFTQADSTTTRRYGGTGLGLAISKRLASLLGGDICVHSRPGAGSTFRVTIATGSLRGVRIVDRPAEAALDGPEADVAGDPALPALAGHILLAEDGPDNQRLISHILERAGAQVTVVENGALAVDAALAARHTGQPYDVILMDMQMPVMDGYQATRLLRQRGYSGTIIALTAHAMASDRERCLQVGCDDYETKPISRKKLIGVVRAHLSRASVMG